MLATGMLTVLPAFSNMQDRDSTPAPAQIWKTFQEKLGPLTYNITKNEIIASETDPEKRLRRLDFTFSSQEVPVDHEVSGERRWRMTKLWHDGVIFLPEDPGRAGDGMRGGKVVIVGSLVGPYRQSFISNYGDPIAALTGYPTMILPDPGETRELPGRMYNQRLLMDYRQKDRNVTDHSHFRWAIPYLRGLDIMAELLEVDKKKVRAVIGGHSKRATGAFTAAAMDPERIAGVVFMGNESLHPENASSPWWAVSPYRTQRYVRCPTFYIGATNEGGYAMFNINKIQDHMAVPWTLEIIPNYRHASESEKQFLDWRMWVAHVFDGRPLSRISDLRCEETEEGTRFEARIASSNKIILAQAWYVYCDDVPYWRDLVWYPTLLYRKEGDLYEGYLQGKIPDAWLVEVQDTARGHRGYVSSLPQDITHKPVAKRTGLGFPRQWERKDPGGDR
jgi:hypothetical protein